METVHHHLSDLGNIEDLKLCSRAYVLAVNETLNVVTGKWKLAVIGTLFFGKKRFKDLERDISKITPRMLSKELKELEATGVIKRTVIDSIPVVIEYELSESGHNFQNVLNAMLEWGLNHRKSHIKRAGLELVE